MILESSNELGLAMLKLKKFSNEKKVDCLVHFQADTGKYLVAIGAAATVNGKLAQAANDVIKAFDGTVKIVAPSAEANEAPPAQEGEEEVKAPKKKKSKAKC